jgi:hypothetical protein
MQSSITLPPQITISTIMGCLRCFFPDSDTSGDNVLGCPVGATDMRIKGS